MANKNYKVQKKQNKKNNTATIVIVCVAAVLVILAAFFVIKTINNFLNAPAGTIADNEQQTGDNVTFGAQEPDLTVTNRVEISVENFGIMKVELYGKEAPITVENFMKYVNSGSYENSTFHRVVKEFMIQGGMSTKESYESIKGEFSENGVKNNIPHERGVISMARTSIPDSATSQFFICHETNMNVTYSLDGKYAAFGKVYEGLDVLDAIANVECENLTGEKSSPVEQISIEYVKEIKD